MNEIGGRIKGEGDWSEGDWSEGDRREGDGSEGDGKGGKRDEGAQYSQEMGGKGDVSVGENEMDNWLPVDTTAGHIATEGVRRKSYS